MVGLRLPCQQFSGTATLEREGERHVSPFIGIVHPEELRVLSVAVDDYCTIASIERESPERERAARLAIQLFKSGVQTPDQLKAALFQRLLTLA
jgi:hypothetical protein